MSTMVIERALLEQALEALEWHYRQGHSNTIGGFRLKIDEKALRELRAALAQQDEPAQEPVAWNWMLDGLPYGRACYGDPPDADLAERAATAGRTVRLLYAAPPQRKQAEPLNLRDPAVRKRLATQWGYVPAAQAEPVERAMQDAVTTGMGIMRGGERIDPSTIYKPIEGVPV